jgi:hypothetical protein
LDQNQPISPCNGDAISASVRIMARSLQHRRVAWMHDFRDSPTRRSSHSTNPEVERRRPRRDTAPPNFRVFKVNQPVGFLYLLCGSNLTTNRPLQNTPVTTERTITPPSRLGALRWVGHRLRLEKRSRASKEWKRMVKFKSTFEAMKLPACPSFDPC